MTYAPTRHLRDSSRRVVLQGYLAHKKTPTPKDCHKVLGIGLLQGPTGESFLECEVPVWASWPPQRDGGEDPRMATGMRLFAT